MSASDPMPRLHQLCAEVGFDLGRADASLLRRLRLLSELTETVKDAERTIDRARSVFLLYEAVRPEAAFSEAERRLVVLGSLFSDIGKTGPASAEPATQRVIIEMFSVEGVDDDQQTVADFLARYFPNDAAERARRCRAMGVDTDISLRTFWNLHSTWTLEVAEAAALPADIIAAAASHHLLENVNPHQLVGADGRFTRPSGDNLAFDRAEKLILLLDKYDAVRRRGHRPHAEAIAWLRQRVARDDEFENDAELTGLIDDLDAALKEPAPAFAET